MNAAVIGATGYSGLELLRLLQNHPYINIHSIHGFSSANDYLYMQYPHVTGILDQIIEEIQVDKIVEECDIVFFATPSGIARELAPQFIGKGITVVDISGDFRLKNPGTYEKWYKKSAPHADYMKHAVYGLSEWNKENIAEAKLLSNPGCYATATLLGLAPLVQGGLIEENSIIVDAKSGVSGAGKVPSTMTNFAELNENIRIYKVNEHQHIPEIEQQLSMWNGNSKPITFSTHLLPMTRGIMATMYANVKKEQSIDSLLALYKEAYADSSFVRIQEKGVYPCVKQVYNSNYCDIGLAYDERTGRVTIVSVIDNMMKGAAGQALQNVNIMNRWNERLGLEMMPIFP